MVEDYEETYEDEEDAYYFSEANSQVSPTKSGMTRSSSKGGGGAQSAEEKLAIITAQINEIRTKRASIGGSKSGRVFSPATDYSVKPKKTFSHPKLDFIFGEVIHSPYLTPPLEQYPESTFTMVEELRTLKRTGTKSLNALPKEKRPYDLVKAKNKFIREVVNYKVSYLPKGAEEKMLKKKLQREGALLSPLDGSTFALTAGGGDDFFARPDSADNFERAFSPNGGEMRGGGRHHKSNVLKAAEARGGPSKFRRQLKALKHEHKVNANLQLMSSMEFFAPEAQYLVRPNSSGSGGGVGLGVENGQPAIRAMTMDEMAAAAADAELAVREAALQKNKKGQAEAEQKRIKALEEEETREALELQAAELRDREKKLEKVRVAGARAEKARKAKLDERPSTSLSKVRATSAETLAPALVAAEPIVVETAFSDGDDFVDLLAGAKPEVNTSYDDAFEVEDPPPPELAEATLTTITTEEAAENDKKIEVATTSNKHVKFATEEKSANKVEEEEGKDGQMKTSAVSKKEGKRPNQLQRRDTPVPKIQGSPMPSPQSKKIISSPTKTSALVLKEEEEEEEVVEEAKDVEGQSMKEENTASLEAVTAADEEAEDALGTMAPSIVSPTPSEKKLARRDTPMPQKKQPKIRSALAASEENSFDEGSVEEEEEEEEENEVNEESPSFALAAEGMEEKEEKKKLARRNTPMPQKKQPPPRSTSTKPSEESFIEGEEEEGQEEEALVAASALEEEDGELSITTPPPPAVARSISSISSAEEIMQQVISEVANRSRPSSAQTVMNEVIREVASNRSRPTSPEALLEQQPALAMQDLSSSSNSTAEEIMAHVIQQVVNRSRPSSIDASSSIVAPLSPPSSSLLEGEDTERLQGAQMATSTAAAMMAEVFDTVAISCSRPTSGATMAETEAAMSTYVPGALIAALLDEEAEVEAELVTGSGVGGAGKRDLLSSPHKPEPDVSSIEEDNNNVTSATSSRRGRSRNTSAEYEADVFAKPPELGLDDSADLLAGGIQGEQFQIQAFFGDEEADEENKEQITTI